MNFAHYSPEEAVLHQPRIIVLDEKNRVVRNEGVPTVTQGRSEADVC
jgi:aspartate 1-decarboxylase